MQAGRGALRSSLAVTLIVAGVVAVSTATTPAPAAAQTAPVPNPTIPDSCGINTTLVLDASGSIDSSKAVESVRNAAQAFLGALKNTNSTARVTQFGTVSADLAPPTLVDDAALAPGGPLADAITGYYDPRPQRPPGVTFHQYNSGTPGLASSWRSGSSTEYTNWDQALNRAQTTAADLVVFVTDGDPTAYDFDQSGDPFPAQDVGYQTDRNATVAGITLDRAVAEANGVKASRRILAVGVGAALSNPASRDRLVQVSGPQVVSDGDLGSLTSINQVDVALVTQFADLAQFLRRVVIQLCSPSLTIQKLAQTAGDATYRPAGGWPITVTPTVPGGFRWILPDTTAAASKTVNTSAAGFAGFQWEPTVPSAQSSAVVQETLQPGYTAGRPAADDYRCEFRDENGAVRVVTGQLSATQTFPITIAEEIGTCTIWNSFDYAPAINVTKSNAPTAVRGDLTPPATVTSTYAVTNPGNTPLSNVGVADDRCAPVLPTLTGGFNVGDTNTNGLLDVPETWQFTCTDPVLSSRAATPAPIVNTATASGTDPTGTTVTDTATASVTPYVPGITLTKLVNGASEATITDGDTATYTYAVTNTGNTPLGTVTLTDDTPPCTSPTPAAANTPPPLQPGQTWNYTCAGTPTTDTVNVATVTAVPLNPEAGNVPFPTPNPPVTAIDTAEVVVLNPNIQLTKAVSPDVVLIGPSGAPEPVTYTFTAQNTGTPPQLNRFGATTAGPARDPGWIDDPNCTTPAVFVAEPAPNGGDTNGNAILDTGETWAFTCPGSVSVPTLNVASITGQPSGSDGVPIPGTDPVSDLAVAYVDVLRPGIDIVKTALVGVVLDPGADAIIGPDVPTRRPAEYQYEITNTGNVALAVGKTGATAPTDDICAPLLYRSGDEDTDDLLDVDETWVFECATTLDRSQGNTPPVTGDISGLVTNTATVTGVPFFDRELVPSKAVTATDTAQVQVIEPGLSLTKTASAPVVLLGDTVTYTVVVTNTGDVGLDLIGPADDECSPLEFVGGDTNGNGILEGANSGAAESWTYTCSDTPGIPAPPATTDVNDAAVLGIDPLGNVYAATDEAEVRIFDPGIGLTKTVSDSLVPSGTTVTYTFAVVNDGASPIPADDVLVQTTLADVSDPAVPTCSTPTFTGGDTNGDGLLDREPPEIWTYTCAATITAATTDVAVVGAVGGIQFTPPLPVLVSAVDAAFVQAFTPAIEVIKTASPTTIAGTTGTVTYTYSVRNTGDVPLAGVAARITDDTCSPVTYVSGDEDGDGLLDTINSIFEDALDETWIFTCTTTVSTTTTNTVLVPGTPVDSDGTALCGATGSAIPPCDVVGTNTAIVTVTPPGTVTIIKRTPAATRTTFEFTFDSPLGTAGEASTGCDPSYPTRCIPSPPPDLDCDDVAARGFEVRPPDPHRFDGDGDGVGCEVETFTLGRDASRTITVAPGTYRLTESTRSGWRLANLECVDATGDSVVTVAERRASLVVAPGETVTCTFTNRPTGTLPSTGSDGLGRSLALGAAFAGVGVLLVVVARKRRRSKRRDATASAG